MKIFLGLIIACGAMGASARPLVVQESARIANPDPTFSPYFANDVAVDGDDAIATIDRYLDSPTGDPMDSEHEVAVWLFHRGSAGEWTPVRPLVVQHHGPFGSVQSGLAMRNGIAALALNPLRVFERTDGDWIESAVTGVDPFEPGDDIRIDGNRILFGGTSGPWTGTLYEKNSAGVWGPTSTMTGDNRGGDDENDGGPVDISGNRAIVVSLENDDAPPLPSPAVTVFFDWGGSTRFLRQSEIRNSETTPIGFEAAIRDDEIFIAGTNRSGTRVYRPAPSDAWEEFDHLQPLDSHMGGGVTDNIEKNHLFIMQVNWNAEREANVINVFQKTASGPYEHVATLVSSDGSNIGNFGISSRRVVANCGGEVCVFDLPSNFFQPAPIQQTFAGAVPAEWTTSAGSAFAIAQRGVGRVLRQSDIASPATHFAVLDDSNWSNESIQADVRLLSSSSGSWHGLATRYRGAGNYYYVRVDTSGVIQLKRALAGVFSAIATAPVTITANKPYRLRLESIGTRHRVYVNGAPVIDADDSSIASGRAALLTHQSSVEFDNVVVSPTPATILFARDFQVDYGDNDLWTFTGIGLWHTQQTGSGTNRVFTQSSVQGTARANAGVPTDDQSIDVRARATTFADSGTGDRWFGVMGRYVDDANYYYLTLRNTNSVSLRKVANGTVTVLCTYSLPITLGTWYRLRLEAVGSQIRGYVNGVLVAEATDSTHPRGSGGPITNRAAVDFDDYRAIQP